MRSLILTLLFFIVSISEGSGAQLTRISTSESATSTQIYAHFDELPLYQERLSDRRLDLTLIDTRAMEFLVQPEPDDVIIKTLVVQQQEDTRLSIFFRYAPQGLSISSTSDSTLIIDLIPGNRFTGSFRELGSSLGLMVPVEQRQETLISPLAFTPYKNNWRSFFADFEDTPILTPDPAPLFPPFPLTSLLSSGEAPILPIIEELDKQNMFESLRRIQKQLKSINKEEERKYYAITHADILFRLGSVEAALTQYKLLADTYGYDDAGNLAVYAAALIEIGTHKFHLAQVRLTKLLDRLPARHLLIPLVRFAIAETHLATGQYEQMNQLLDLGDFPPSLHESVELRRADHAYGTGRFDEAFATYDKFYGSEVMAAKPLSINHYCSMIFNRQAYDKSRRCYLDLASMLNEFNTAGSAHYLATLAELKAEKLSVNPEIQFGTIIERFPGTEAALLAEMKQADICALRQDECAENASQWFRRIAGRAASRAVAESATFKEALVLFLEGQPSISIELLQKMLRTYQSGELQDQAQALLIQLIPSEIERLLDAGLDIEAIALAQQNRALFEKGWLDDALLFDIGLAFERLAMHPEALQLFLYLKNGSTGLYGEDLLFATIRTAHALGAHHLVEDLASEYTYRYPEGVHELDVLYFRLDCMYAVGQIDEALLLLPVPLPQRLDFRFLGATLNFQKRRYQSAADILLPVYQLQRKEFSSDTIYILAESLYELGEFTKSEELFVLLAETEKYRRTARHRIVLISGWHGKQHISELNRLFLAEKTDSDPWHRFAVQDSRYRQLISNL
ncbi:MAG: hypothetical protein HKP44_06090 [Desulfofustis sp.]|nr:hypothetical protein [Desulfofustis sp.]